MTVRRVSVERSNRVIDDLVVESIEGATAADLREELLRIGADDDSMVVDGQKIDMNATLDEIPLRNGSILSPYRTVEKVGPGWYLVAIAGPDTGAWARVSAGGTSVGRASSNSLVVKDSTLSATHFRANIANDEVVIEDLGSTNGTLLEGQRIVDALTAQDGTYISAGVTTFGVIRVEPDSIAPEATEVGSASPFQRRFRDALKPLPNKVKHPTAPRETSDSSRRSWVSLIIPIVISLGMAAGMVWYISSSNSESSTPDSEESAADSEQSAPDVEDSPSKIFGVIPWNNRMIFVGMMIIGPMFFAIDGLRRRRKQNREKADEKLDYREKQRRFLTVLEASRREERDRDRWAATPAGLAALLPVLPHTRLWERSDTDEDFCEVAIGLASQPSRVQIEARPERSVFPLDTHWAAVLRHSLLRQGSLAVIGPMERCRALARALILDLATSHSPNDIRIWLLTDSAKCDSTEWNAVRWLPHTYMGEEQNQIFSTTVGRAAALSGLRSIIAERDNSGGLDGYRLPIHIVVVDCIGSLEPEELTDLLVGGAPAGVVGIVLDEQVTPEGTSAQLVLGKFADGASFVSQNQPRAEAVRSFEMKVAAFAPAARSMASLRPAGSSREVRGGAQVIRLVDLIDAETASEGIGRVIGRWQRGGTSRVCVGGLGDLTTEIDIMRDGPHGLVGGTTRSGKTEFLKSLFTSLAVVNHPNDLSIVIVDFKGGVDHELSAQLPHVIDLSTNHNVDSFVRTVRLIEAEMLRRQRAFKAVGAPNFDAYRAARDSKPSLQPVPRLLVVIDEFSELLSSETGKANLSSLESVTRVGGGLGVHLLLVTQNFENQLPSQIAANAGLRICFRVQEPAHSKAVLNSPEAASIPKERIGRAFLRSHGGRVVEFQAARVAGPRPGKEVAAAPVKVRIVPFTTLADTPPGEPIVDVPAEDTDMYAVVKVIQEAATRTGWTAPVVPWPKELSRTLGIGDVSGTGLEWPLGLLDEPERQRQSPTGLDAYGPHALFIGGASARLSEVMRAVATSGAIHRSPEELHFYVIDQLGQGLSALQALPHTGGAAERNEPLALRILRHIAGEVAERKSRLSKLGMSSVAELRAATGETLPDIVLLVHGADRLLMHGESQPSPLLAPLLGVLPDSVGTGIRVLLTGPSSVAHHRLGSSIGHRFVLSCPDSQEYSALGVSRALYNDLDGIGREPSKWPANT